MTRLLISLGIVAGSLSPPTARAGTCRGEWTLRVVVDKQLTGWKDLKEEALLRQFDEVRRVGHHPDLPQRIDDKALGSYCKRNDCALITSDSKAYTHFFAEGTETVQIRKYGHNIEVDQPVYIIRITGEV